MILKNEPIFSSSFELALFWDDFDGLRGGWLEASAVEGGEGVCPGSTASLASRRR